VIVKVAEVSITETLYVEEETPVELTYMPKLLVVGDGLIV